MNDKYKNIIILLLCIFIAGIMAIYHGFHWNYDIRSYHLYNPYAFLTGRVGYDIMPGSIQSYFNPLPDVPFYLFVKYLNFHPKIFLFVYGLNYALLLFVTYKIAELIFTKNKFKIHLSILSSIVGNTALYTLLTVGGQTNDQLIGVLIVFGIYFIIKALDKNSIKYIIFAGIILGVASGFKYTGIPLAFSLLFCIICFPRFFKDLGYKKVISLFFLSGIVGFLIANGFWMYKLYTTFGNPFMPHYSEFFRNTWINSSISVSYADLSTTSIGWKNFIQCVIAPFEATFDYRFITIILIFIFNCLFNIKYNDKEIEEQCDINMNYSNFLLLFSLLSIFFMSKLFPICRYMIAITSITGIVISVYILKFVYCVLKNVNKLSKNAKQKICHVSLICVCIFIVFSIPYEHYNKRMSLKTNDKQIIYAMDIGLPDNALVITTPGTGYVIPFQNPKAKFIFINDGRYRKAKIDILSESGYKKMIKFVKEHSNNIYILIPDKIDEYNKVTFNKNMDVKYMDYLSYKKELKRYGINDLDNIDCKTIKTNFKPIYICKVNNL